MTSVTSGAPRDLVIVSDLHLGRGRNPALKRWYRLEAFFYDDDFHAFCEWLCSDAAERGLRLALVLNGDIFDLLRIEPEPVPGGGAVERRFGPTMTPSVAARIVRDILAGHPTFADALAVVLAAGHEVIVLPGNHDLEVQWAPVQETLRGAIAERLAARGAPADAVARLRFEPWFLYEPGRIWIEHGCQYDPEGAFRFPLRGRLGESPAAETLIARDVPFGNFFQKYLYNGFGPINFIVPSSRANYRYFRFLLANRPRLLLSVARSHGPFLVQLLRRLARPPAGGWQRECEQGHAAELAELGERSGLGTRLSEVDALKSPGADAARVTSGMLRQAARVAAGGALVTLATMFVWAAAWRAVDSLIMSFGWKTLLSLALYVFFGAIGLVALVAAALRTRTEGPPPSLEAAAERIARLAEVPLVVFGHTHDEGVERLGSSAAAWYFNTGTWVALFSDDLLVPRERVQYTFLRVSGRDAELLQWSPGRGRPIPAVLLEGNGG